MKHSHLRHDKHCLNCGAHVADRFCSHCGQENTEPIESFVHLISHFFADVTHWDSQFLTTIKYLVFKPGFLTRQYNAGKRLSYLNPIRMYIFISAVFFLLMFSGNEEKEAAKSVNFNTYKQHLADSLRTLEKTGKKLSKDDSIRNTFYTQWAGKLDTLKKNGKKDESVTIAMNNHGEIVFKLSENKYNNVAEYEAAQKKLPDTAKDGSFSRYAEKKILRIKAEHDGAGEVTVKQNIAHDIPKLMFILLPLFAVFVSILYAFYNKKKYVYSQHAIFSLHFHSFVFLMLIVIYFITKINMSLAAGSIISFIATLGLFVYLVAALHNVYQQGVWLSILKAFAISVCYTITMMICSAALMFIGFLLL